MRRREVLRGLLLAPAAGWAETGGRVYVYARRETPARTWTPVFCGGSEIAAVKAGRFFAVTLAAGRYTFGLESGVPVSVEVGEGAEIYLQLGWRHQVERPPVPVLARTPAVRGREEMRFLSYIEGKRIRSREVADRDPRAPEERLLRERGRP